MREDLGSQVFHYRKGYYLVQTTPSPSSLGRRTLACKNSGGEIVRDVNSAPESGEVRRGLNLRTTFAFVQASPRVTKEKLLPLSSALGTQPIQIWFGWTLIFGRTARRQSTSSNLSPLTTVGVNCWLDDLSGRQGKFSHL